MRFDLDMTATGIASAHTRRWNNTIRMGYLLKEEIDPERLRRAVADIAPRFPSFFVALRRGFFWYYLKHMDNLENVVRRETAYPCRPFYLFAKKPLIRVLYDRRRLAVEIPHTVSDGGGLKAFVLALLARYLELGGLEIPPDRGIITDWDAQPRAEELSDDYRRFNTKVKGKLPKTGMAYQYRAPHVKDYLKVIHGSVPLEDILPAAKARGLTVTDYLMAAYLWSFYHTDPRARSTKKRIQVRVSVNMRNFYPSQTLRNFTLFSLMGFHPRAFAKEDFTFEDMLAAMRGKLKASLDPALMHAQLCQNVSMMEMPVMRAIPNAVKRWFFKIGYLMVAEKAITSVFSNLGRVELPPCMSEQIENVEFIQGGSKYKRITCFLLSDHRMLHLFFSAECRAADVQRTFFRLLVSEGLRVRAETNVRQ